MLLDDSVILVSSCLNNGSSLCFPSAPRPLFWSVGFFSCLVFYCIFEGVIFKSCLCCRSLSSCMAWQYLLGDLEYWRHFCPSQRTFPCPLLISPSQILFAMRYRKKIIVVSPLHSRKHSDDHFFLSEMLGEKVASFSSLKKVHSEAWEMLGAEGLVLKWCITSSWAGDLCLIL